MGQHAANKPHVLYYKSMNAQYINITSGTCFYATELERDEAVEKLKTTLMAANPHKIQFFYGYIHEFKSYTQIWEQTSGKIVENPYIPEPKTPEIEI